MLINSVVRREGCELVYMIGYPWAIVYRGAIVFHLFTKSCSQKCVID
ncbi:MAG: hypothetical protein OJF59_000539 [Cytophagales bacterium]|nr:hypothetical protein [Bacteroidota bacterium]MBS1981399.1 hypothetical protein [Bacteroidota bacterium]WHZ06786.1 MAG: hypothetical protein OJF59_000539 [Cytophagales bacterium]